MSEVQPNSPGVSRSSVSRLWQEAGSRLIEELRNRDLSKTTWCILMLDGIRLSSDQTAVVAIGIDSGGRKHVLGFALGNSENSVVANELMARLVRRGFSCQQRLLRCPHFQYQAL